MHYYLYEAENHVRIDGIIHTEYRLIGKFNTSEEAHTELRHMEYLAEKDARECGIPSDTYTYKIRKGVW